MIRQEDRLGFGPHRSARGVRARVRYAASTLTLLLLVALASRPPSESVVHAQAQPQASMFQLGWSSGQLDNTTDVAWGDVDNDGDLDLAVANKCFSYDSSCSSTRLYLNDGGKIADLPSWSTTYRAQSMTLAWGDVDNDGDLDLAVGNVCYIQPCTFMYLFINEDGRLVDENRWPSSNAPAASIYEFFDLAWGDVDGDSDLDLVVATYQGLALYRNASGTMEPDPIWQAGGAQSVVWGDVDADGDLDLVGGTALYLNHDGTLSSQADWIASCSNPCTSTLVDYDNDRDLDLAWTGKLSSPLTIYEYRDGTFGSVPAWKVLSIGGSGAHFSVADIDHDGDVDLLAGWIYRNRNDGSGFDIVTDAITLQSPNQKSAWGDYDNDGDLDLAVSGSRVRVYEYVGGLFRDPVAVDAIPHGTPTWGDYDADGDSDLIYAHGTLFRNDQGRLWRVPLNVVCEGDIYPPHLVAWGDVDADGDLDLAVGGGCEGAQESHTLRVYRNEAGIFDPAPIWMPENQSRIGAIAWADVDNDGRLDLAASFDGVVRLYRNEGSTLATTPIWSGQGTGIAWGDLEGDGDLDLLVSAVRALPTPISLGVYRNNRGTLGQVPVWTSSNRLPIWKVLWTDYDGDGDLDIAATAADSLHLYANHNGSFDTQPGWSLDSVSGDTAWGDYDQDGDRDLAVHSYNGEISRIRLYNSNGGVIQRDFSTSLTLPSTDNDQLDWGDVDGDGDLDLVAGRWLYYNLAANGADAQRPPRVAIAPPAGIAAPAYAIPQIISSPAIPVSYTLMQREGIEAARVVGEYSLEGGGLWRPAFAASGTVSDTLESRAPLTVVAGETLDAAVEDVSWMTSTITLTGEETIHDLDVAISLTHPRMSDLQISLTSPSGTMIRLVERPDITVTDLQGLIFDDSSYSSISYYPSQRRVVPVEPLRRFIDEPVAGTWTLRIIDYSPGESGTFFSWELHVLREQRASSTTTMPIPAQGVISSTISISSTSPIADLDVELNIAHDFIGDLAISMVDPAGRTIGLIPRVGGDNDNFFGTILDANVSDAITDYSYDGDYSGRYRPAYYEGQFPINVLWGEPLSGTWTLVVSDQGAGGVGELLGWSLRIASGTLVEARSSEALSVPPDSIWQTTLPISDSGNISDLNIGIDLSHPDLENLEIRLFAPDEIAVSLIAPGDAVGTSLSQTVFDDEAATSLRSHPKDAPYSGRYKANNERMDDTLYRSPAAGLWTLRVRNFAPNRAEGVLHSWAITVTRSGEIYRNEQPMAIPDYTLVTSTVEVSDPGIIKQIEVGVKLEHSAISDLYLLLETPFGMHPLLTPQMNKRPSDVIDVVFADDAPLALYEPWVSAPFAGRYRPLLPFTQTKFWRADPRGPWTLRLLDPIAGDTGILHSWTLTLTLETGVRHTYVWDTFASGVMGQSDNAVFRLRAIPDLTPRPNAAAGPYLYGSSAATSLPFRMRGTQVRVTHDGQPARDALVYRLPAGQDLDGAPFAAISGEPFQTDAEGYLQGRGSLALGDRLLALVPIADSPTYSGTAVISGTAVYTPPYTLYYTNGIPHTFGLTATEVLTPGVQTIDVSAGHPLYLFDLSLSLEWDASKDSTYLDELQSNLVRASRHLYDFTDGQMALGHVTIYYNGDNWSSSDIVVHASNRLRPFAAEGGIVLSPTLDLQYGEPSYDTGQVHMGATWNRYGRPGESVADDWALVLAHELAHYLLFVDDTYLGRSSDGFLEAVETCTGSAMGDVYQPANTEFIFDRQFWERHCGTTLAQQELKRTEWETLKLWYPALHAPTVTMEGPSLMPFNLTTTSVVAPLTPTAVLDDPTFTLDYAGGVSSAEARAFLVHTAATSVLTDDYVVDLGSPLGEQNRVLARGAQVGDRLCVFDRGRGQHGCEVVRLGDSRLALRAHAGWTPLVQVTPVTTETLALEVTGWAGGLSLQARLFPEYGGGTLPITLTEVTAGRYEALLPLTAEALVGHVQLWVAEPEPRREVLISYALGGNPAFNRGGGAFNRGGGAFNRGGGAFNRGGGAFNRGGGAFNRGGGAPLISPDGQLTFLPDAGVTLAPGTLFTVQSMPALPALPTGKSVVGQGYQLVVSTTPVSASLSVQYVGNDVQAGGHSEDDLQFHYWDGTGWRALETRVNTVYNLASARSLGTGIYVLLAGRPAPTVAVQAPVQGTAATTTTVVLQGGYFVGPVTVELWSLDATRVYTLPVLLSSPVSVTAVVSADVPLGEYRFKLINGDHAQGWSGAWPMYPAPTSCFEERFASGLGQWTATGSWAIAQLPSGELVLTDSPGGNYASAYSPQTTVTTTVTSRVIDLGACAHPVLTFRHDYLLARTLDGDDWARLEIQRVGGAGWTRLRAYTGAGSDVAPAGASSAPGALERRYVPTLEWADVAWREVRVDLSRYGGAAVRLRLVLEADRRLADAGWVVDDLRISSGPPPVPPVLLPLVLGS